MHGRANADETNDGINGQELLAGSRPILFRRGSGIIGYLRTTGMERQSWKTSMHIFLD